MRSRRTSAALVGTCLFLVGLTGCSNPYDFGAFALSVDGSRMLVATCLDRDIKEVSVDEIRPTGVLDAESDVIWKAAGDLRWATGEALEVGGQNSGLHTELRREATPEPGMRYFITTVSRLDGVHDSARFTIPDGGLPEGVWLSPYGEQADEPCDFTQGWWVD